VVSGLVGVWVGFLVGDRVGRIVGLLVGVSVGFLVGDTVGVLVGLTVGVSVGFFVGLTVGVCPCTLAGTENTAKTAKQASNRRR